MSQASTTYHHGDLRAACLRAARELLEESGNAGLSLRAVARRAGVSATAPYRHYADRDALLSAVAAEGYRELAEQLVAAHPSPVTPDDFAEIAVAYVRFALAHPALFRVMFVDPCDSSSDERVRATEAIWKYVNDIVHSVFPGADVDALSTGALGLVHGLAFLHIDGKFDVPAPEVVDDRVRAAVRAMLEASPASS
ncbi:TetR/AcrR family transcriptional regulator [Saccharopolyspora sp. WRP15-2]|uniref:TetR/AcrR family transcriptional regulator n=1 Tax=Saccharopolyspora oryzae TaxID=2997343 RepID=A0ABT4UQE8_9PSEU|nr:TetR/AcrR family transcriptional regulator [Saccharopolyspora oryzae]MDA3623922.1 TetR/AcrR family transcriptional regulator [Saccharopolyspora oryzae]